jgi:hypothetical protein
VAKIDWSAVIDLERAVANIKSEFPGDWHQDPWGWPELGFMLKKRPDMVFENCGESGTRALALLDVPKENWGTRPAVVLDIADRLTYQAPHARRVLALSALGAGETRTKVKSWLSADQENAPTLAMLESFGWSGPKVQADFAN